MEKTVKMNTNIVEFYNHLYQLANTAGFLSNIIQSHCNITSGMYKGEVDGGGGLAAGGRLHPLLGLFGVASYESKKRQP